jgi:WD40 repeat protein
VLSVLARVRPLPPLALCRPVTAIEAGTREDEFQGRLAQARRLLEAGDTRGALREARALREIPGYERSRAAVSLWRDLVGVLPRKGFRAAWEGANLTGHADQVTALALAPSGRLFSSSMDGTVRAWDLKSEAKADVLRAHDKAVAAIALGPDGRLLSGGWDHVACAWEPGAAKPRARFTDHTDYVTCAAWAGSLALTGSSDHSLRLWDAASGRAVAPLEGHTSGVSALAVSPDGRFAISGSWDGTVRAWDLVTREAVVVLGGDAGPVSAVAIGPDARQVVSGHQDGAIRLWNLKLRNARILSAHTAEVQDLVFCPDARHLLSAGKDRTVRLWDVVSGQCTRTFAQLGTRRSTECYLDAASRGTPDARAAAAANLNFLALNLHIGPGDAFAAAARLARDSDPVVRSAAASSLVLFDERTARRLLTPLATDPDSAVRTAAEETLAKLEPLRKLEEELMSR